MRILVVAQTPPWPATFGGRIRLANMIRGLGALGEIDLVVLAGDAESVSGIPPTIPVRRVCSLTAPRGTLTIGRRLRWMAGEPLPIDFVYRDFEPVRQAFAAWKRDNYDLVWCSRVKSYLALWPLINAPTIVDIDDLENQKIAGRLHAMDKFALRDVRHPGHLARNAMIRIQGTKSIRRWELIQREIAHRVQAVVVCSALDATRLGASNAVVVPNGYDFQAEPVGRVTVGQPPTIVLTGYFNYPPNVDSAVHFVDNILPLIRSHLPTVQVRLVGDAGEQVLRLGRRPGVTVTGFVKEMRSELTRADVVAVPIRYGSGTRIKILEAFAHRIPVVSTPLGAEGIDAVHGREIMVGDTPRRFADSCLTLLSDEQCRGAVIQAAHDLFLARYRWDNIHRLVASVGAQVVGRGELHRREGVHPWPVGSHVGRL